MGELREADAEDGSPENNSTASSMEKRREDGVGSWVKKQLAKKLAKKLAKELAKAVLGGLFNEQNAAEEDEGNAEEEDEGNAEEEDEENVDETEELREADAEDGSPENNSTASSMEKRREDGVGSWVKKQLAKKLA